MAYTGPSDGLPTDQITSVTAEPGQDRVEIPDSTLLSGADYSRLGNDLVLEGSEGTGVVVRDYFSSAEPPTLATPGGAEVDPETVALLLRPLAPAQYAQVTPATAVEPIGEVTELTGSAQVTRTSGIVEQLTIGDPVFQGDIVETGTGGSLGITFADDTLLSISGDARLVLDELIFNPGGSDNELSLSLLSGTLAFVSGKIAPADGPGMAIKTPVATIGVRGTTGAIDLESLTPVETRLTVTLLEGLNDELGALDVFTPADLEALIAALDTVSLTSEDEEIPPPETATSEQLALYGLALASLTKVYLNYLQEISPELGPEPNGDGIDSSGGGLIDPLNLVPLGTLFAGSADGDGFPAGLSVDDAPLLPLEDANLLLIAGAGFLGIPAVTQAAFPEFPTLLVNTSLGLERGLEESPIPLIIEVTQNDTDGAGEVLTIEVSDIPVGATLINDNGVLFFNAGPGLGSVEFGPEELAGLAIIPPAFDDADFVLTVTATTTEPSNPLLSASVSAPLPITVLAVADLAHLTLDGVAPADKNPIAFEFEGRGGTDMNDSFETAQAIGSVSGAADLGLSVDGWISKNDINDIDFYSFEVTQAGAYRFDIDFGGDNILGRTDEFDAFVSLFDAAGNLIGTDDDSGANSQDPLLSDVNLEPGTYFIAVTTAGNVPAGNTLDDGFTGGATQGDGGDYNLQIRGSFSGFVPGGTFDMVIPEDGIVNGTQDVELPLNAAVQDDDGSESVTQFLLEISELPDGFVLDLGDGPITSSGAYDFAVMRIDDGGNLITDVVTAQLSFVIGSGGFGVPDPDEFNYIVSFDPALRVQEVDFSGTLDLDELNGLVSAFFTIPSDSDQDFTIAVQVRTTETNPTEGSTLDSDQVALPHAYQTATINVTHEPAGPEEPLALLAAESAESGQEGFLLIDGLGNLDLPDFVTGNLFAFDLTVPLVVTEILTDFDPGSDALAFLVNGDQDGAAGLDAGDLDAISQFQSADATGDGVGDTVISFDGGQTLVLSAESFSDFQQIQDESQLIVV